MTDNALPDVTLTEAFLGYDIYVDGERAGAIEGVPGSWSTLNWNPY
jgi:hypothetical protein